MCKFFCPKLRSCKFFDKYQVWSNVNVFGYGTARQYFVPSYIVSLEQADHCWKRWWIQKYHRRWFTKAWTRTLGHLDGRYQPGLLQHQRTIIHIFFVFSLICFFKVLSDKALPVLCLFAILVYWTLGLSLPSTDNLLEEDVSECVSLFWLGASLDRK